MTPRIRLFLQRWTRGGGPQRLADRATDAAETLRDRGEDVARAVRALARRITNVVRWSLALSVPLALAAAGFAIAGADRYVVFGGTAAVTALAMWLVMLWWTGSILTMEVGETTLRHLRHQAAVDATALVTTARRGLVKVLAISALPLGAALWALVADPEGQWLAGAILLVGLVLSGFAFVGPQGMGRWLLIALVIGAVVAAALVGLLGNEDSYLRDAQERHAAAVALEREQHAATATSTTIATGWRTWRFEETYILEPGQRVHVDIRGDATAAGVPTSAGIHSGVAPQCRPYGLIQEFVGSGNMFTLTSEEGPVNTGHESANFWLTNTLTVSCTVRVHAELM